jgi:regulator of RNase E activity RraA
MPVTVHAPEFVPLPEELLARWREVPVSIAVDLAPERQVDPLVRPLRLAGQQPGLFGRAVTARCAPPDFGSVLHAVGAIGRGEVLVIDAGGDGRAAVIGDVLGGELHRKGAAGLVCDGAVRDTAGLAGMDGLAVYARSVNPKGPDSAEGGEVNGPVEIGGCTVAPGDLVIGDGDGLVVLPPALLATLIDAAEAKLALEAEWRARLAAGEAIAAIFGLSPPRD